MAATLRRELPHADLTITVGDFEHVPSTVDGTYDALFSATAYHWIDPAAQVARPAELLVPGGLLAIVDLIQVDDDDVDRGFFDAVQPIYERYGEGRGGALPPPRRHEVDPPIRAQLDHDERLPAPTVRTYDWDLTYRATKYRELLTSYSGTQTMEPAAGTPFLDDMERFVVERFRRRGHPPDRRDTHDSGAPLSSVTGRGRRALKRLRPQRRHEAPSSRPGKRLGPDIGRTCDQYPDESACVPAPSAETRAVGGRRR